MLGEKILAAKKENLVNETIDITNQKTEFIMLR